MVHEEPELNRRDLVRRSLAVSAGGALAIGQARTTRVVAHQTAPVADDATPGAGAAIALDLPGGSVWAWDKQLAGTCPGCPPEATIVLRVNGQDLPAERDGDAFAATVRLRPGENEIAAVAIMPDGSEETSEPVIHRARLDSRPTARIAARVEGDRIVFDGATSEPSGFDQAPLIGWSWSARAENPSPLAVSESGEAEPAVPVPTTDGEYYVSLTVEDAQGRTDTGGIRIVVEGGQVRVPDPMTEHAAWIDSAVVYGVIPRAFGTPPLQAVTADLDDLKDLGVTALWLSPINTTIPLYFGYEVIDYFDVRADYGTKDDLRELVREAHARDLRVLMDFVPSHTSDRHPYFLDAQENGPASQYYDYYQRDAGGNYTYYFGYTHLPNLNFENQEVKNLIAEAMAYWVREFDIDGYRVDFAWAIRERRPDFWPAMNAELYRIKPDVLLLAEASARDPYYFDNGFAAAYDWTEELGHWAWGDALGSVAPIDQAMIEVLTNEGEGYHPDALIFRFLNNNDTGARLIASYGLDFYRVAAAMLLTLPGLPCVYTGDEVGAEFEPYGTTTPIDWSDEHNLRPYVQQLIDLRRSIPSLHSRDWQPVEVEPGGLSFGYLRPSPSGAPDDPTILVLLNFGAAPLDATVTLPDPYADLAGGDLTDLMTDEPVPDGAGQTLAVMMPGWGVRVLSRESMVESRTLNDDVGRALGTRPASYSRLSTSDFVRTRWLPFVT